MAKKPLKKVPMEKRPNGECFCRCGREAGPGRHFVAGHDKRAETILNGLQKHQRIVDRLVDAGYHEERITTIPDEREAVDAALRYAQRDDLLLIFGDAISRCWKQVTKFDPGTTSVRKKEPKVVAPIDPGIFSGEPAGALGESFVEDARGVILSREAED